MTSSCGCATLEDRLKEAFVKADRVRLAQSNEQSFLSSCNRPYVKEVSNQLEQICSHLSLCAPVYELLIIILLEACCMIFFYSSSIVHDCMVNFVKLRVGCVIVMFVILFNCMYWRDGKGINTLECCDLQIVFRDDRGSYSI